MCLLRNRRKPLHQHDGRACSIVLLNVRHRLEVDQCLSFPSRTILVGVCTGNLQRRDLHLMHLIMRPLRRIQHKGRRRVRRTTLGRIPLSEVPVITFVFLLNQILQDDLRKQLHARPRAVVRVREAARAGRERTSEAASLIFHLLQRRREYGKLALREPLISDAAAVSIIAEVVALE